MLTFCVAELEVDVEEDGADVTVWTAPGSVTRKVEDPTVKVKMTFWVTSVVSGVPAVVVEAVAEG